MGTDSQCPVCRREHESEGSQDQHSGCTCPVCGGKCVSFRGERSVFRIEHRPPLLNCANYKASLPVLNVLHTNTKMARFKRLLLRLISWSAHRLSSGKR
uniref:Uncharacterized protein n=1 Tax=Leptospirillum sp. Group II '5-way CG' TaxID=419541 RepID=B6AKW1_9BACT|nr:MAG: Hypothetical protein CGL2_10641006a [Leptospirillum sp. Group II '5-way CG']